jgi:hypothetical protein
MEHYSSITTVVNQMLGESTSRTFITCVQSEKGSLGALYTLEAQVKACADEYGLLSKIKEEGRRKLSVAQTLGDNAPWISVLSAFIVAQYYGCAEPAKSNMIGCDLVNKPLPLIGGPHKEMVLGELVLLPTITGIAWALQGKYGMGLTNLLLGCFAMSEYSNEIAFPPA